MHIDICLQLDDDVVSPDQLATRTAEFERHLRGEGDRPGVLNFEFSVTGDLDKAEKVTARLLELQEAD